MALDHYPLKPGYGDGICRRRIRLHAFDGHAVAVLNDDYHTMWCRLDHDGAHVTAIEGGLTRGPKDTCPGAPLALRELVGLPLDAERRSVQGEGKGARNCTHLLDLALLLLRFIASGERRRIFDFAVPDEGARGSRVTVHVNGTIVHDWTVVREVIQFPTEYAGRPLFRGFSGWAEAMFDGVALDAALMVQKAMLVARGNRRIVDKNGSVTARDEPERAGHCYTYSEPRFSVARNNVNFVRDHTQGIVEDLPDFLRNALVAAGEELHHG